MPACAALRLVKSGEEVAALQRGAALSDAAIAALAGARCAPGRPIMRCSRPPPAGLHRPGRPASHLLPRHHRHGRARPGRARPVAHQPGDPPRRRHHLRDQRRGRASFHRPVLRTFTVGAPPTALYAELHAVATAVFDAIAATLIPGARARDLAAAAAIIGQAGLHRDRRPGTRLRRRLPPAVSPAPAGRCRRRVHAGSRDDGSRATERGNPRRPRRHPDRRTAAGHRARSPAPARLPAGPPAAGLTRASPAARQTPRQDSALAPAGSSTATLPRSRGDDPPG